MNFGSAFAFHDSDDEEEQVREDAPAAGPLSSMSAGPVMAPPVPSLQRAFLQQQQQQLQTGASQAFTQSLFLGSQRGGGLPPPPVDLPAPRGGFSASPPGLRAPVLPAQAGVLPVFGAARGPAAAPGAAGTALSRPNVAGIMRKRDPKLKIKKEGARVGTDATPPSASEDGDRRSVKPEAATPRRSAPRARTWTRKVDTNILNVDMAALGDAAAYATGDPSLCRGCRACLSAVSILTPAAAVTMGTPGDHEGVYEWVCEYCHEVNRVELDDMEKPVDGQDSVDYVLEATPTAAAVLEGKGDGGVKDESAVLFVIDTSGSMCVTTAVEGRLTLRGDRTKDLSHLLTAEDARNQLMPGQRRGVTYVSRLQSMQAAIDAQLESMAKDSPSRHAGLVTFNAEVSLIGDGSGDSRIVAGDRLSDREALTEVGRAYPLSRPVSEARGCMVDRLFALEEGGPTALGPAVVAGLSMLKERGGRGSRLVLCTDGLANVGLGALDDLKTVEEREIAEAFYEELGRESASNGVTIDVVSVDSDACDLENLGAMADVSGGTVTRVKASELTSNFAGILANPVLASQVSVRVILHKGLMFRNADVGVGANTLDKDIGNVTRETELNFEYQVRPRAERRAMGINNDVISSPTVKLQSPAPATPTAGASPAPPTAAPGASAAAAAATPVTSSSAEGQGQAALPFQVQIRYTRLDGTKCLRVMTKTQPVTKNRAHAEQSISMAVVAGHAASNAGHLASKGAYQSTRVSMRAWNNLMSRNQTPQTSAQVERYGKAMSALDSDVLEAQMSETGAAADMDEGGAIDEATEAAVHGRARKSARSTNDNLSFQAYTAKNASKKSYQRDEK
eukprot:g3743.t1